MNQALWSSFPEEPATTDAARFLLEIDSATRDWALASLQSEITQNAKLQHAITHLREKLRAYDPSFIPEQQRNKTYDQDSHFGSDALQFFLNDRVNLVRYLRGCKYNIPKCLKKLKNTLKFYVDHPQWIYDMVPVHCGWPWKEVNDDGDKGITTEQNAVKNHPYKDMIKKCDIYDKLSHLSDFLFRLNLVDEEKRTLCVVNIKKFLDFTASLSANSDFNNDEQLLLRLNLWFFHQISFDPMVQLYGFVLIGTFADLTMWQRMTLPNIAPLHERKSMFLFLQDCLPLRVGGFWIFEEPFYVRWLFGIISLVMKDKFKERFHLCGNDYNKLHEYLKLENGQEILPICLGGQSRNNIDIVSYLVSCWREL